MIMQDCVTVRRYTGSCEVLEQYEICGVLCTVTDAISVDGDGFSKGGQLIVRIPGEAEISIACGDGISPDGGQHWYTVTELRDNRRQGSGLSHLKVIGRR
ncbi:MAG: hypothetical protein IJF61_04680 [Clostridia bacterium]|nr:hypothetical protein [Clostridia bacterium]